MFSGGLYSVCTCYLFYSILILGWIFSLLIWFIFFIEYKKGYKPFVEACIDADEKAEAVKYIAKLADPREKAEV